MAVSNDMKNAEIGESSQQLLYLKAKNQIEKKISLELQKTIMSCELAQSDGYKQFLSMQSHTAEEECLKIKQHQELVTVSMVFLERELDKITNIKKLFYDEMNKSKTVEHDLNSNFHKKQIRIAEINAAIKSLEEMAQTYKTLKNDIIDANSNNICKRTQLERDDHKLKEIQIKYMENATLLYTDISQIMLKFNELTDCHNEYKTVFDNTKEEFNAKRIVMKKHKDLNTEYNINLNTLHVEKSKILNQLEEYINGQSEILNKVSRSCTEKDNECSELLKFENELRNKTMESLQTIEIAEKKTSLLEYFKIVLDNLIKMSNKQNDLKSTLMKCNQLNVNISSEYEKSLTTYSQLKEKNQETLMKKQNDTTRFNEWKKGYDENAKQINDDFDMQILTLQKELSEIKEISKNSLESQTIIFESITNEMQNNISTQNKYYDKLASDSTAIALLYNNALNRKENLSNKYQYMQEIDGNQLPGILKTSRPLNEPSTSVKNVTFRPNVSYESASQLSVDSYLEEINRINNSKAQETNSVTSNERYRKRNRFD